MATYFVNKSGNNTTGSSWANAYTTMAACIARPVAAGDTIWVGDDHTETQAVSYNWALIGTAQTAPYTIACVDHTVASPGLADLRQGGPTSAAFVSTTNTGITIVGNFWMYGLYFMMGTGATGTNSLLNNSAGQVQVFEKCYFGIASTAASIGYFTNNAGSLTRFIDSTFKLAAVSQVINVRNTRFLRCNFDTVAGIVPTTPLTIGVGRSIFEACDFSNLSTSTSLYNSSAVQGYQLFKRCKLPFRPIATTSSAAAGEAYLTEVVQCGTGASLYRNDRAMNAGLLETSIVPARVGGAADYGSGVSWKMTTYSFVAWTSYLSSFPIVVWNDNVSAPVSITVEGIADPRDFPAMPTNDQVWIDAEYLGTTSYTLGTIATGTKANPLATATPLTVSTADWTAGDGTILRQNLTAYSVGNILKVATRPGMLFIVTTAGGTSSVSEAAYASVVDGQTGIVDGATMRTAAFWRFKQTITLPTAAAYAGYIYVSVKVGKGSVTNGLYIDPMAVLA